MAGSFEKWADDLGLEREAIEQEFVHSSIQEELVETNYGNYNSAEVIEAMRVDLNFLARVVLPDVFEYDFPPLLVAAWALLMDGLDKFNVVLRLALGIPRGHAKTTLLKLFILYCILFTKKKFILVVAVTATHAENIIRDVITMLEGDNVVKLFGRWDVGVVSDRADFKIFSMNGRVLTVYGIGKEGQIRGANIRHERPDVMVMDDVQPKEESESQLLFNKLKDWLYGTLFKSRSPKGCMYVLAGNMYPGRYSLLRDIKNNPTWIKFISGAILESGEALWPELRSLSSLKEEFEGDMAAGKPEIFLSEVMNDTDSILNSSINTAAIALWPYAPHDMPQGRFIIIDPAPGRSHKDPCTISYFEVWDGKPAIVDYQEGDWSPAEMILRTFHFAIQKRCSLIVCESTSYQASLLYWFEHFAQEMDLHGLHFMPVYNTKISKNSKILGAIRSCTSNMILIHDKCRPGVLKQMVDWNPLKRDNNDGILDTLSYCEEVLQEYGGLLTTVEFTLVQDALQGGSAGNLVEGAVSF